MFSRGVKSLFTVGLFAAALVAAIPEAAAQSYWFESYERAIELTEAGRNAEASALLDKVMRQQPAPIPDLRVPGNRFIDYVPYHYRARLDLALGNARRASHNLDVSEAFGEPGFSRYYERENIRLRQEVTAHRDTSVSTGREAALVAAAPPMLIPTRNELP